MTEWTEAEDLYLKENYGSLSAKQCAGQLNRTRNAVIGRADRLGLTQKGSPGHPKLAVEEVPRYKHRMGPVRRLPPAEYKEPLIPQVNDVEKLHSRQYSDLEPGMCYWPVYYEQGVQMYCAAAAERLPGRYGVYCRCHREMSQQPRVERQRKYRQGVWAR